MVVRTRPPQTPVMPRSIADAPRRWPRRLAAVAILRVVSLIGLAVAWVVNVEPLSAEARASSSTIRPFASMCAT